MGRHDCCWVTKSPRLRAVLRDSTAPPYFCFSFAWRPWPANLTYHRCCYPLGRSQAGFLSCQRLSGAATLGEGCRDHKSMPHAPPRKNGKKFVDGETRTEYFVVIHPEEPCLQGSGVGCQQEWRASPSDGLPSLCGMFSAYVWVLL